ncbi:MAG: hypothetical protein F6J94_24360 [Moorea sp. SIO1F2]|uniref:hypothetical protein n=1 Tax=unclassified Moorena TaxID=2683338 RepID=UPI0013B63C6B|nr:MULTISPECIES: hypothetical protein [unclassified Moorena]NEO62623.1 hypothetical protein [Moorena sp. SIO4G2]NEO22102.1 hypothetical protein [Moorena sp. SIO4A5]NEP24197.1 hypothetical protein [Moorena sp. SIO3I6]NEQ59903.1 hypothetical protein [Moorena sp. SIO4A1]NET84933.1 hypothetical protein [Moorena sp. SIO1F2]
MAKRPRYANDQPWPKGHATRTTNLGQKATLRNLQPWPKGHACAFNPTCNLQPATLNLRRILLNVLIKKPGQDRENC